MNDLASQKKPEHHPGGENFDFEKFWVESSAEHIKTAEGTFKSALPGIIEWVKASEVAIKRGNKVLFFGNGGSAADSNHIAAEMAVKLWKDRSPIAGLSLTLDSSALTASANDYGFEEIYQRQVRALGYAGDVAVGLSTSGNSENILNGLKKARRMEMVTVGLTGESGGKMPPLCDILIKVPSTNPGRIQEMHITLGHIYVGMLEQRLGLV